MTNAHGRGRRRRGAAALAAVALLAAACSGGSGTTGSGAYGSVPPPTGTPKDGGTVSVALSPGISPNYIYPNEPSAENGSVIAHGLMWKSLYTPSAVASAQVDVAQSLAKLPTFSPDRKTVTVQLNDYTWSTGGAVTGADVVFTLDLLKAGLAESAANWSFYTPGQFPDGITARATGPKTVVFTLTKAYNPSYFVSMLQLLYVMPSQAWNIARTGGPHLDFTQPKNAKAIYDYLTNASKAQSAFTSNPLWQVVDGPYRLKSFDPATGSFSLTPNTAYSGPVKSRLGEVDFKTFTSTAAVFNQYKAGTLDVGTLDSGYVSQVGALKAQGYNVYGAPAPARFDSLVLNFGDTTNHVDKVIAQLYVRQALQHLIDQPGYVRSRGVYDGAGATNYTTGGANSPYPPAFGSNAPYPYSLPAATALLTDHGWKVVPGGTTTCIRPGTATNECGAGIPAGQTLSFNLVSGNSPAYIGSRDIAFASAAKQIGITITTTTKSLDYMYANLGNPFAPAHKNDWAMQDSGALYQAVGYPSSNTVFNTSGSFNLGSYSDPEADARISASTFSADPKALSAEETYLGQNLPVLFLPVP
ncbi:MAG: hypothetical protein J0H43_08135, partial [Actinobacteria bacterium]|nr:hypothetical protein [Actinomycetota bacterium]